MPFKKLRIIIVFTSQLAQSAILGYMPNWHKLLFTLQLTPLYGYISQSDYFYRRNSTMSVPAKIDTIQPIDGAKGNIALFYYQGKYPIYKSLDDNMYHLGSVRDAYKASTDKDISKTLINDWTKLKKTQELVAYFSETGIPVSKVLTKKRQQSVQLQHLDGWYANEEAMLDFAGWLNAGFKCEIYRCFAMSAERDRLNADINHKQSTIEKLEEMLKNANDKLDKQSRDLRYVIDQNDDLLGRMDNINTHVEAMSPIATSLTNRISTTSDEHLLLYADDHNENTTRVRIHAINSNTMKKRGYKQENAIAHIIGGNMVNAQNELFTLVHNYGLNVGSIDRKTKSFYILRVNIPRLQRLIDDELNSSLNYEKSAIERSTETITTAIPKRVNQRQTYKGYPVDYCKKICRDWSISKTILTEIINGEWVYNTESKPIHLHKTKGLLYETRVKGKTVYKPVPTTYWLDEDE